MILMPPGDGHLGPVHELQFCWHDCVHLDAKPELVLCIFLLSSEDMVLLNVGLFRIVSSSLGWLPVLIPLPFSRQARRRTW
jgi:hypothetical protein